MPRAESGTLPAGSAQQAAYHAAILLRISNISIHAPRAGATGGLRTALTLDRISIHVSREGSDTSFFIFRICTVSFQFTPPCGNTAIRPKSGGSSMFVSFALS